MGNLMSNVLQSTMDSLASYWSRPSRILLLGLDDAGKTTLLYKLKLGEAVTTIPTIGFNVETFTYKNIEFTAWDFGGHSKLRQLWRCYLQPRCDAVIFVVDAADRHRIDEAADELRDVFRLEELADTKLLVFANKQDRPECMKVDELRDKLNLPSITKNASHIAGTVATTGTGVYEGLDWLVKAIRDG